MFGSLGFSICDCICSLNSDVFRVGLLRFLLFWVYFDLIFIIIVMSFSFVVRVSQSLVPLFSGMVNLYKFF